MKVDEYLRSAAQQLEVAGIATARLDSLVLIEDVLNTNRTQLLAEPEHELTDVQLSLLTGLITKRAQHIPLAYLRGETEFYGRKFIINENVLEPRPESETMIDVLKALPLAKPMKLADIGSGSGALGITAGLENPMLRVTLIEIDASALDVAQQNVNMHKVAVQLLQNDLLDGVPEQFDVLLCNLPYVPNDFHINTAARHEPSLAIFGGPDGLDIYRRFFDHLSVLESKPQYVLTESMPPQHDQLKSIAFAAGYKLQQTDDFIQLFQPVNY